MHFFDGDLPIRRFYNNGRTESIDSVMRIENSLSLNNLLDQNNEMKVQRRAHKRFKVEKDAFVLIRSADAKPIRIQGKSMSEIACAIFRSNPIKLGKMNNISMGGLSFNYIEAGPDSDESYVLDIVLVEGGFYLGNVHFKSILDIEIVDDLASCSIMMRQLSVKFNQLTQNQNSQLIEFICDHSTAEV